MTCGFNFPRNAQWTVWCHHMFPLLGNTFLWICYESWESLPGKQYVHCILHSFRILGMSLVHPRNAHRGLGIYTSAPVGMISLYFQVMLSLQAEQALRTSDKAPRQGSRESRRTIVSGTYWWDSEVSPHRRNQTKGLKKEFVPWVLMLGVEHNALYMWKQYLTAELDPCHWILCILLLQIITLCEAGACL